MTAWQPALFVAAALLSLVQFVRPGRAADAWLASREAHAVHVVMNLAMAVMASPLWTGGWRDATLAALWATGAVLAARLVGRRRDLNRVAATGYHLCGVAAMIYAAGLMTPAMSGMAMHGHGGGGWLAVALGWLFLLDGAATLLLAAAFPRLLLRMEAEVAGRATAVPGSAVSALRLSAIPHVVMDAGMALMLL